VTLLARAVAVRWRVARALLAHAFAMMTEYRAEISIWILSGSLPLVMMAMWIGLAADASVGGYDAADFAAYFLLVFLVRQLTGAWVVWELDRAIRLGELSPRLLRPLDPMWYDVADHVAEKVVRLPLVLLPVVAGLWWAEARLALDAAAVGGFAALVTGAAALRFFQQYAFALLAFWTDQAVGLERIWFSVMLVTSGALAPLDLYPAPVRAVVPYTPFPYLVDVPVQTLLGRLAGPALVQAIAIQAAWLLGFVVLRALLWRYGLRRYAAVGA
jgi:ABC-2 type transport system permease protein